MTDVLSQSEVESLLAALDPGVQATNVPAPDATPARVSELNEQISVYDFKRPERVSKEQMRAFQALHDGFSREFGAALSGMLRTIVEVKLISVDQLTYSEFVFSLENPTCFVLLRAESLDGHVILDLNPSILFPIVDRLLGGGKDKSGQFPRRPLTEIELRLVSRIINLTTDGLRKAWSNVCDLQLRVTQVESNPQLVQIVPPNEVIVLISFEITMGETRGIMNLCVPFNTIEPLAGKLSSNTWSNYTKKQPEPAQVINLETGISTAKVQLIVEVAEARLKVGELRNLAVGDVIVTEKEQTEGLKLYIEGALKYDAYAGVLKGRKAVRIGKPIVRPSDVAQQRIQKLKAAPPAASPGTPSKAAAK